MIFVYAESNLEWFFYEADFMNNFLLKNLFFNKYKSLNNRQRILLAVCGYILRDSLLIVLHKYRSNKCVALFLINTFECFCVRISEERLVFNRDSWVSTIQRRRSAYYKADTRVITGESWATFFILVYSLSTMEHATPLFDFLPDLLLLKNIFHVMIIKYYVL